MSNTTPSTGGLDAEDDDSLTRRIYLAPSVYSCAGPRDAYEYYTREWRGDVADVRKKLGDDTAVVAYLKCVGRMLKGEDVLKASSDKGCEVDKRECPKCHTGLTKALSTEVGQRKASEA